MSEIQMVLFHERRLEKPSKSDKPAFSKWSYSRRGMLEQCPRKYYRSNIGHSGFP